MGQLNLFQNEGEVFEAVTSVPQLYRAFKRVKSNQGAPGVDGVTIQMFEEHLRDELATLSLEIREWRYRPQPVRQVEIPKPGSNETRKLGVPCLRDRVVQSSLQESLELVFASYFSDSSFGFRHSRSQHDAVEKMKEFVSAGYEWAVDIDLSKFFDRVNHDRLMWRLSERIKDKRVLRLIGMTLRSGISTSDGFVETAEGVTQGSPLSPLLSNIVLDELDKELEKRGLRFCRFADDVTCFVGSRKAANRVLRSVSRFIETRLKLVVNREKSQACHSSKAKFLGFTIRDGFVTISKD